VPHDIVLVKGRSGGVVRGEKEKRGELAFDIAPL
jgi:hypothetical protein